jgi:hypothetical protein
LSFFKNYKNLSFVRVSQTDLSENFHNYSPFEKYYGFPFIDSIKPFVHSKRVSEVDELHSKRVKSWHNADITNLNHEHTIQQFNEFDFWF